MKFEKINSFDYNIYVYSLVNNYENISDNVKVLIKKLQKRLKLSGFYKVIVCGKNIGLFIQIIQLDKSFYNDILDLKIEVVDDLDVYYKTSDYFLIKDYSYKYYYQDYFYGLIDDKKFDIMNMVEFGEFVFGSKLNKFLLYRNII